MSAPSAPEPFVPPFPEVPITFTSEHLRRVIGTPPGKLVAAIAYPLFDWIGRWKRSRRDALARFIGKLAFALGIRRKVALDNLAHAMPELPEAERRRIARGAYVTMARVVLESIGPGNRLPPDWNQTPVHDVEAFARLKARIDSKQGALMVTAHFGNWELFGEVLVRRGIPLNALVRPLKGALNTRIAERRVGVGAGLIYPKGAIDECCAAVRRGETVYALLDQALPAKAAVFVPFFGRLASTTPAVAVAAKRTGAPVFVVMGIRDAQNRFETFIEEVPPPDASCEDPLTEHTARITAVLEKVIRQHPEQWLWLHRRWKVQPPAKRVAPKPAKTRAPQSVANAG